jgi:hypothetical protein
MRDSLPILIGDPRSLTGIISSRIQVVWELGSEHTRENLCAAPVYEPYNLCVVNWIKKYVAECEVGMVLHQREVRRWRDKVGYERGEKLE